MATEAIFRLLSLGKEGHVISSPLLVSMCCQPRVPLGFTECSARGRESLATPKPVAQNTVFPLHC